MIEMLLYGALQGIAEWLPVSSEGMIVLAHSFFNGSQTLSDVIEFALFLHLGTFLAALIYLRKDVGRILRGLCNWQTVSIEMRPLIIFLITATAVTGVIGGGILYAISSVEDTFALSGDIAMVLVGILLLGTAFLQYRAHSSGPRTQNDLTVKDALIVGTLQGLAALPGFSRSGFTTAGLLLRGVRSEDALVTSFLMSLPVVLGGNIILNASNAALFSLEALVGLLAAFAFGWATIAGLIAFAQRVNFAHFLVFFGVLAIAATFI